MSIERVPIKPLYKDVFDRYAIKKRKIKFGKINLIQYYYVNDNLVDINGEPEDIVDISSVLFRKDGDGHFTPYVYEFKINEDGKPTGKVVKKGTIVYDFILFAKDAMGTTDVRTGRKKSGSLYPIQYIVCIPIVLSCIRAEGTSHLLAGCRQLGKTTIINNLLAGFIGVFAPRYMILQNGYFAMVTSSYTEKSVGKAYENTKVNLEKAISLHNKMYPKTPLVTGKKFKKSDTATGKANAFTFDIGKVMNGEHILYTRVFAITTGADQDGLTSNCTFLDEPQNTSNENFKPIAPFTDSVSGITLFTGIGSDSETDVSSTYYRQSKEDSELIKTYRIPIPVHLNLIVHTDMNRYNSMLRAFYSKMLTWGGMTSTMSQKHYFASFSITNGKFLTNELLGSLGAQALDYDVRKLTAPKKDIVRRVAGLDIATIHDYCVLTTLDCYSHGMTHESELMDFEEAEYTYKYIDGITFNENGNRLDFKTVSKQVAKYCKEASIDILMLDATHAEIGSDMIYTEILELGITTLVIPFRFSSTNKENMMWHFESAFFGGLLKLLKGDDIPFSARKLVEEMLYLVKSKNDRGKMEWQAPKGGSSFTDDHVMSIALAVYAIKRAMILQSSKSKSIIKIGVKEIDSYDDRFIDVLGNRFKDAYEDYANIEPTFIDFF